MKTIVIKGKAKPADVSVKPENYKLIPSQGQKLEGKYLVIKEELFPKENKPKRFEKELIFKAEHGFGCSPETRGTGVFGVYGSGLKDRMERYEFEYIIENAEELGINF